MNSRQQRPRSPSPPSRTPVRMFSSFSIPASPARAAAVREREPAPRPDHPIHLAATSAAALQLSPFGLSHRGEHSALSLTPSPDLRPRRSPRRRTLVHSRCSPGFNPGYGIGHGRLADEGEGGIGRRGARRRGQSTPICSACEGQPAPARGPRACTGGCPRRPLGARPTSTHTRLSVLHLHRRYDLTPRVVRRVTCPLSPAVRQPR
jgi:hypothetical protein